MYKDGSYDFSYRRTVRVSRRERVCGLLWSGKRISSVLTPTFVA